MAEPVMTRIRQSAPITTTHGAAMVALFTAVTALTIAVTRFYLMLMNYPSVGGATYHLAHALWGGLALTVAAILALALDNRWVPVAVAITGGVGTGLFVDEVGKFITRRNDYFFPLAAPIVYLCLVLMAYAAYALGRARRQTARAHLYAALNLSKSMVDGPVTPAALHELERHLQAARRDTEDPAHTALLDGIEAMASARRPEALAPSGGWLRRGARSWTAWEERRLPLPATARLVRWLLVVVAVLTILGALSALAAASLSSVDPTLAQNVFREPRDGEIGYMPGPLSWAIFAVGAVMSIVAASCYLRAAAALKGDSPDAATAWRRTVQGAVIALVVVNSMASYIDQFAILSRSLTDIAVLAIVARLAHRSEVPLG